MITAIWPGAGPAARLDWERSDHESVGIDTDRRSPGRQQVWMRRPASILALVVVCLLLPACTGPSTRTIGRPLERPTPAPSTLAPTPTGAPTPTASPLPPPPTGPPPKPGTLAWYLLQLPRFPPPPRPAKATVLPATGPAQQFHQIPVGGQRVAFITIDDGWLKDPDVVTMLRTAHIPFTMFLTSNAIKSNPSYFASLAGLGGIIEGHTISHPKLSSLSYTEQRREICDNRATLAKLYGRAPIIMRAPYNLMNANTLQAAASCGIRANVSWNEYAIDGTISWQRPGGIHPGDMVLMHFDKYLKANLLTTLQAFHRAGITPALLEDYLVLAIPAPIAVPPAQLNPRWAAREP